MQLGRQREVESVVLAGVETPQEGDRLLPAGLLFTQGLRPAKSQVPNRAGARTPAELS
jgi:predicted signal transduction protein with EAL and GGDEF domain